ncbi:MAG: helix-turn-helix transcriptional regulator [Desulfobacterales bacterium]|nr:helix-turn-helix transcriptional regulator [Desulfobacterales bacterium]
MEKDDDKAIFTRWLKKAIKVDNRITGKKLAEKVDVHPSTISGYITDKSKGLGLSLRLKICDALNVDYFEIIDQERKKTANGSSGTIDELTDQVLKRIRQEQFRETIVNYGDSDNVKLHKKINEFSNLEKGHRLNLLAVELEKIDPDELEAGIKYFETRLQIARQK